MQIPELKARLSIAEVLAHYGLQADKNNRLCCPFHPDKTPSMQVYPDTNTFCCFSANCSAGTGDAIQFIELMDKQGKHQALVKAKSLIGAIDPAANLTKTAVLTKAFSIFRSAFRPSEKARSYAQSRSRPAGLEVGYNFWAWAFAFSTHFISKRSWAVFFFK